mmetsp:Transcript_69949/g.194573  ORF Transcript_69949/g.194573 Transcript_69949/m.194573 type:complete len:232 (+) Transcript_69949:989-1684(+)
MIFVTSGERPAINIVVGVGPALEPEHACQHPCSVVQRSSSFAHQPLEECAVRSPVVTERTAPHRYLYQRRLRDGFTNHFTKRDLGSIHCCDANASIPGTEKLRPGCTLCFQVGAAPQYALGICVAISVLDLCLGHIASLVQRDGLIREVCRPNGNRWVSVGRRTELLPVDRGVEQGVDHGVRLFQEGLRTAHFWFVSALVRDDVEATGTEGIRHNSAQDCSFSLVDLIRRH